jgi:hypothetical protein
MHDLFQHWRNIMEWMRADIVANMARTSRNFEAGPVPQSLESVRQIVGAVIRKRMGKIIHDGAQDKGIWIHDSEMLFRHAAQASAELLYEFPAIRENSALRAKVAAWFAGQGRFGLAVASELEQLALAAP